MGNEKNYGSIFLIALLLPMIIFLAKAEEAEASGVKFPLEINFEEYYELVSDGHINMSNYSKIYELLSKKGVRGDLILIKPYHSTQGNSHPGQYDEYGLIFNAFDFSEGDINAYKEGPRDFDWTFKTDNLIKNVSGSFTYKCKDHRFFIEDIESLPTNSPPSIGSRWKVIRSTKNIVSNGQVIPPFDLDNSSDNEDKLFRILYPSDGSKIAGYTSPSGGSLLKWFDVKVEGEFKYNPSWYEMDKFIQTGIINSTIVRIGEETRSMGRGVGLKGNGFKWIIPPGQDRENNIVRFEMTLQSSIFSGGNSLQDFTVGVSVPQNNATKEQVISLYNNIEEGVQPSADFYKYISDSIKITFTQDNSSPDYVPPNEENGESNGNIDGTLDGGGFPSEPEDGNIISWLKYIVEVIIYIVTYPIRLIFEILQSIVKVVTDLVSTMSSFTGIFSTFFGFLPREVLTILSGSITIMVMVSIFKFLRG